MFRSIQGFICGDELEVCLSNLLQLFSFHIVREGLPDHIADAGSRIHRMILSLVFGAYRIADNAIEIISYGRQVGYTMRR